MSVLLRFIFSLLLLYSITYAETFPHTDTFNSGSNNNFTIDRGNNNELRFDGSDTTEKTYDFSSYPSYQNVNVSFKLRTHGSKPIENDDRIEVSFNDTLTLTQTGNELTTHFKKYSFLTQTDNNGNLKLSFKNTGANGSNDRAFADDIVIELPLNTPPTISLSLNNETIIQGQTSTTVVIMANDEDNDTLTCNISSNINSRINLIDSLANLPSDSNCSFNATPTEIGTYISTVTANDGSVNSNVETYTLNVIAPTTCSETTKLCGEYFNKDSSTSQNTPISGTATVVRSDSSIDFDDFDTQKPSGINSEDFQIRWTGCLTIPISGTYKFQTWADDGVKLWVNNQLIVDNWVDQGASWHTNGESTEIYYEAGEYPFKAEYYERSGGNKIKVAWISADAGFADKTIISSDFFSQSCGTKPPPEPEDEDIPNSSLIDNEAICSVFEDGLQTRDLNSTIDFSGGSGKLYNNSNTNLNTYNTPINGGYGNEITCNDNLDGSLNKSCTPSGVPALSIGSYNILTPETFVFPLSFDNSSADSIIVGRTDWGNDFNSSDELDMFTYNVVSAHGGLTPNHLNFKATNQLKIGSIQTQNENEITFTSKTGELFELQLYNASISTNNTFIANTDVKNIKIHTSSFGNDANVSLNAKQTVKIDTLTTSHSSSLNIVAQYVNINTFTDVSGVGQENIINLQADYIDIGTLNLGDATTLNIIPLNNTRVIVKMNHFNTGSNNIINFSEGDYYIKTLDTQGSGSGYSWNVESGKRVNLFLEEDWSATSEIGINSDTTGSANLCSDSHSALDLFIYSKGNITISNNSRLVATIYSEKNVILGSASYVKGAVSAKNQITLGNGTQVCYEEAIATAGWDECTPIVEFTQSNYSFDEPAIDGGIASQDYFTVTATLEARKSKDVIVEYETFDDSPLESFSAEENVDYKSYSFILTIPAGDLNASLKTTILRDDLIELDETFNARLLLNKDIILGTKNTTQLIINGQSEEDIPLCFSDNFNTSLDEKWRPLSSSGGWIPRLVDNAYDSTVVSKRLRLTNRQKNLATAVTKDYEFLAKNNLIIVEFEQYSYGGCESGQSYDKGGGLGNYGADGIVMVLFDSQVGDSPTPGAYGGSMGYAQGHGRNGFQAGWIGLGIDEYGNFSNPTEGRNGGSGFHPNSITIRGSSDDLIDGIIGNDSLQNGYRYLSSDNSVFPPVASKKRSPEYPGDKYRLKIDARDPSKLLISLDRDIGSGYQSAIPVFDAKNPQYNQASAPEYLRLAFTAGSGGGCNNHDIDELSVKGVCRAYEAEFPPSQGAFDAWDTSGDISNRNIQTKIANQNFNLAIASINSSNNGLEAKEDVIMQYRLYDSDNNIALSSWQDYNASTGSDAFSKIDTFNIDSAHKDVRLQFSFCGEALNGDIIGQQGYTIATLPTDQNGNVIRASDGTVICSGSYTEISSTYSTDNFAIRPDKFDSNLTTNPVLVAGIANSIQFRADKFSSTFTDDYNETENSSFSVDINISDTSKTCAAPNLNFSPDINFTNGNATSNFFLDNVGDFNLTIQEKKGSEFALVDDGDTSDTQRYITPYTNQITIIPDHFEVNASYSNGSGTFTYLSDFSTYTTTDDINISSLLDLTITAQDNNDNNLTNYTDLCYAKDGNISITIPNPLAVTSLNNFIWNETIHYRNGTIPIAGTSYLIPIVSSDFNSTVNGQAELKIRINFDRQLSFPEEPFNFEIQNVSIIDSNGTSGTINLNQNATFYYGRAHAPDQRFDINPANAVIYYEVYCRNCNRSVLNITGTESVDSIDWYVNPFHTIQDGDYNTTNPISSDGTITNNNFQLNTMRLDAPKVPHKDKITFTPDTWLVFNRFNAAATTDDFLVEFFRAGSNWSGEGALGHHVDLNVSTRQNRRIDW